MTCAVLDQEDAACGAVPADQAATCAVNTAAGNSYRCRTPLGDGHGAALAAAAAPVTTALARSCNCAASWGGPRCQATSLETDCAGNPQPRAVLPLSAYPTHRGRGHT